MFNAFFLLIFITFNAFGNKSDSINKKPKIQAKLDESIMTVSGDIIEIEPDISNELIKLRKSLFKEMKDFLSSSDESFLLNNTKVKKQELFDELSELKKYLEATELELEKKISSIKKKLKG